MQNRIARTIEAYFGSKPKGRENTYYSRLIPDFYGTPVEETNGGRLVIDYQERFATKQDFVNALSPIAEDVAEDLGVDPRILIA